MGAMEIVYRRQLLDERQRRLSPACLMSRHRIGCQWERSSKTMG